MKAIITKHLVRPTRRGNTIVRETIHAREDNIVVRCNEYILTRVQKTNFIPVREFEVVIYNSKNRPIKKWNYKPTYR